MTRERNNPIKNLIDGYSGNVALPTFDGDAFFADIPRVASDSGAARVIKRQANEQVFEAQSLVEQATQRANAIAMEIERETAQARDAGRKEGLREAAREMAGKLHTIEQQASAMFQDAEDVVLDISFAVARKFINANLTDIRETELIAGMITKHAASRPYTISVGRDAYAKVEQALQTIRATNPQAALPAIVLNPTLGPERAVLKTEFGIVDLDIDGQLNALRSGIATESTDRGTNFGTKGSQK